MAAEETMDGAALDAGGGKGKGGSKKLILFIALPILLLGGIGGGLFATGMIGGGGHGEEHAAEAAHEPKKQPAGPASFFDLPELLVNLNTKGKRTAYLKINVSLEVQDGGAIDKLTALQPRIVDNFQVYLRELRPEDLQGSAGMARLREELLRRVNGAVEPIEVQDVLFREILVQ